jgi:protein-S-isoprenylcysteine O-methyltransferase Ste14
MGRAHARLDVVFDVTGAACIAAALWLHLWAAQHAAPHQGERPAPATGPYLHMRHPRQVVYVLVAIGIAALAESDLGLVLIPAVLIAVYRVVAHVENGELARRFGAAHAARCAQVPLVPWPTPGLLRAAAGATPWRALPQERRFVLVTLLLAGLADLSELLPRLF